MMSNTEPAAEGSAPPARGAPPPDVDRDLRYFPGGVIGVCRLRVWHDERTIVVTERDDNEGWSVTNAAEEIADAVEALLDIDLLTGPHRLIEHYPPAAHRGIVVTRVRFASRRHGAPCGPTWGPLPAGDWLFTALDERDDA